MLNPAIGRWMQEDPIRTEGGDTNLYRDVHNAPTNFTDPTGLAEAKEFKDEFFYLGKTEGKDVMKKMYIKVTPGVTYKGEKNTIRLGVYGQNRLDDIGNIHWLQFVRSVLYDKDGHYAPRPPDGRLKNADVYRSSNEKIHVESRDHYYVDAHEADANKPFYNQTAAFSRDDFKLEIFDWPDPHEVDGARFSKSSSEFEAFVVWEGKVLYHVHWERNSYFKGGEWSDPVYENIRGEVTDRLPAWALGDDLLGGWDDLEKGTLKGPFTYKNPIDAALREQWRKDLAGRFDARNPIDPRYMDPSLAVQGRVPFVRPRGSGPNQVPREF